MDDLTQELLRREIGSGFVRMQPQVRPSIDANKWQAVQRAMAMLPEATQDTMPNLTLLFDRFGLGYYPSPVTQAFVDPNDRKTINVVADTELHNAARKGDTSALQQLASILVHEHAHAVEGVNEPAAYDAQIDALRSLGASDALIQRIRADKQYATRSR